MILRVIQPFGRRTFGSEITSPDEIKAILNSDHAHYVVKAPKLPEPEPEPDPEPRPQPKTSRARAATTKE